jgi:hypothetical protein
MVAHQEMQIRQLIWAEFRSGKTKQEACAKFDTISALTIDKCYARMHAGKTSIFDNATVPAIQTLRNEIEVGTFI